MAAPLFELEVDARQLVLTARAYERAGGEAPTIIARALNHTGAKGFTQVKRTLSRETGVKAGTVAKAVSVFKAHARRLEFTIDARGGAMSLKEFGARQTKRGVSAAPWKRRRVFPHTFVSGKLGGHVFKRVGKGRFPIKKLYGPSIPREMIRGESEAALNRVIGSDFGDRVLHELERLTSR